MKTIKLSSKIKKSCAGGGGHVIIFGEGALHENLKCKRGKDIMVSTRMCLRVIDFRFSIAPTSQLGTTFGRFSERFR